MAAVREEEGDGVVRAIEGNEWFSANSQTHFVDHNPNSRTCQVHMNTCKKSTCIHNTLGYCPCSVTHTMPPDAGEM